MTDNKYYAEMSKLIDELRHFTIMNPFDPVGYEMLIARFYALHFTWHHHRRRRPWAALISVIILLIVLVFIVYQVLTVLYMEGS